MTADPQPPWTGPWAEDARRIFEILQNHDAGHDEGGSSPSPECRYCPLCQGMALVRRSGPEVLDRVAELAAGLAATLRATAPGPSDANSPEPAGPAPAPPVTVPIDVSD